MIVREKHYKKFIDDYATTRLGVDGAQCYVLRGGVIHRGNASGHPKFPGTHIMFTTPKSSGIHGVSMQFGEKKALSLDLGTFCSEMIAATIRWYEVHKTHPKVIENLPRLLSYRPFGLPPFVSGIPVIASEAG
jgi:hypothetical protein